MMPVRRLMARLDDLPTAPAPTSSSSSSSHHATGSNGRPPLKPTIPHPQVRGEEVEALLLADRVTAADILQALSTTRPSSDGNMLRLVTFLLLLLLCYLSGLYEFLLLLFDHNYNDLYV